jgi:histidine triad (HIT) family protein
VSQPCIFCRIAAKDVPAGIVYEDTEVVAFRDLSPQAPTHVLVIPKRHVASLNDMVEADAALLGAMMLAAKTVALAAGLTGGYRVVTNSGPDAGQSVSHYHLHVLGGRPMSWPPG